MKDTSTYRRELFAFTLIELLVVIAIIGILAALLAGALAGVNDKAKKDATKAEISSLVTAIGAYQAGYSRLPTSTNAVNAARPDFTFGTINYTGVKVTGAGTNVVNANGAGYQESNAEVISILRADAGYRV